MRFCLALVVCALAGSVTANAAAVYSVSATFSTPSFSAGGTTFTPTFTNLTNQTYNAGVNTPFGQISFAFTGTAGGSFNLTALGETVTFTVTNGAATNTLTAVLGGTITRNATNTAFTTNTLTLTFNAPSFILVGTTPVQAFSGNNILSGGFTATNAANGGANNTQVTANPEPATMGLMRLSLLGLGLFSRRRSIR